VVDQPETKSNLALRETSGFSERPVVKAQNVVEEVGHFKYFRDGKILINFIDKVKLFMDDAAMQMFLDGRLDKSFCFIYLPDNSEHEVCMAEKNSLNFFFTKYIAFLEQWISWLIEAKSIQMSDSVAQVPKETEPLSSDALQMHLNQLKLFNYTIEQNTNMSSLSANKTAAAQTTNDNSDLSLVAVGNLLKQNNKFLSEISK
jgi:hypothetical protein